MRKPVRQNQIQSCKKCTALQAKDHKDRDRIKASFFLPLQDHPLPSERNVEEGMFKLILTYLS